MTEAHELYYTRFDLRSAEKFIALWQESEEGPFLEFARCLAYALRTYPPLRESRLDEHLPVQSLV